MHEQCEVDGLSNQTFSLPAGSEASGAVFCSVSQQDSPVGGMGMFKSELCQPAVEVFQTIRFFSRS